MLIITTAIQDISVLFSFLPFNYCKPLQTTRNLLTNVLKFMSVTAKMRHGSGSEMPGVYQMGVFPH